MAKGFQKILNSKFWWLWLLLLLAGINYLASDFHTRLDLTKEKRYTLSKATKELLRKVNDDLTIEVFLKGEFPSGFRKLANTTREFLGLLKDRSPNIHYSFISPLEELPNGRLWGDSLSMLGAMNINLTVRRKEGENSNIIFPVALLTYKGQQALVNLFPGASREISQTELNTAEALMEYQFVKELDKLIEPRRPGIAYAVGNGEPMDERTFMFRKSLQGNYDFRTINLKTQPGIPNGVDLLLIVKPEEQFTDQQKMMIDQYVMNGGKLLCFIDNLHAEMDSFRYNKDIVAYDRNLNLTDLFFRYGLRVNTDLVMNLACDVNYLNVGGTDESPQMEFLPWNYFPFAETPGKSKFSLSGYVGLRFANSIDTINVEGVTKTPLLITPKNSRTIGTPALISLNENKLVPEDAKFNKTDVPVAMLLEGNFTSFYKNRVSQSQLAFFDSTGIQFKPSSEKNKMIVVADGDLVLNDYRPQIDSMGEVRPDLPPVPMEMGWNKFTYTGYLLKNEDLGRNFVPVANRDFFLNCVEYLVSNPAISETRNKDIVLRLLDSKKVRTQKTTWQFINIAGPVLAILLFALIYQQIRRRKYAA